MNKTMNAIRIHAYGDQSQLTLENIAIPALLPDDVLVKIHTASVNPVDWKIREGYLKEMLPHQLPLTLGWDFAGEIVALGENVTTWRIGDKVYSRPNIARNGSYAEFIAVNTAEIALKPESLSWQEAAATPLVALTAWQSLYDIANLKAGERVLIHAGAGGVGSFAIQLAKLRGAYVYSTCSTGNVELVKSFGADEVIDYKQQDFAALRDLDLVFDTLGGEAQAQSWQTLKRGGRMVSIINPLDVDIAAQHGVTPLFCFVEPSGVQLEELNKLFAAGKLHVQIDSEFALKDVVAAHARSESGRARGKIVIQVA